MKGRDFTQRGKDKGQGKEAAVGKAHHVSRGGYGKPGAGSRCCLPMTDPGSPWPPTPHSHTPQPDGRNHDLLWLMMAQKVHRPLILTHTAFEKQGEEGGAAPGEVRKVRAPRRCWSRRSSARWLLPGWGLALGRTSAHCSLLVGPLPGACPMPSRPDLFRTQRKSRGPTSCKPHQELPSRGFCVLMNRPSVGQKDARQMN